MSSETDDISSSYYSQEESKSLCPSTDNTKSHPLEELQSLFPLPASPQCQGRFGKEDQDPMGYVDSNKCRFTIYLRAQDISSPSLERITLEEVLRSARYDLPMETRLQLALAFATSYLQLYSMPWMSSSLPKDEIFFLRNPQCDDSSFLNRLYVKGDARGKDTEYTYDTPCGILGVRLLELCHKTPLEDIKFRQRSVVGDTLTKPKSDSLFAIIWCLSTKKELGIPVFNCIFWCLRNTKFEKSQWREEVFQNVVVPLERWHRLFSGEETLRRSVDEL
ncbi:hypothetical protein AJ79_05332 [Helicocarpus griseus UAMH5409]|uniref:DUF7580 domain-containing protein n=1 Tax=Helicocarpus griseus UAMH5409 TaxID=1447875 RepID=A0A2B7XPM9_9EURO|nr:hypothetical protein AJ79_05332 [Helicocarpus griseus UAMH5409]